MDIDIGIDRSLSLSLRRHLRFFQPLQLANIDINLDLSSDMI